MRTAYLYLCIPGRMIYPKLPEIDEELIKLKHFEAIHDLCSLVGEYPLSMIKEVLKPKELATLTARGEVIVSDASRLKPLLREGPVIKGVYAVLRLRKLFRP